MAHVRPAAGGGAGADPGGRLNYCDPKQFTALFRARRSNHGRICAELHVMSGRIAMGYRWPTPDDRDDAAADATLHAIEQIGRFDRGRGSTAFAFFTAVLQRHMLNTMAASAKRRRGEKSVDPGSY